jgi:ADP-heptose:LPS heptosyltransferase
MKEKSVDLVGKTNIRELGAVIQGAKAVVTNDSAPMHLASAIDTPTIAVFGPTDSSKYGPLASKSAVITFQVDCSPCGKAVCARDYECLKGVSIERVFNELKKLCGS